MSYSVPVVKAEDVIRALGKASFELCDQTTAHVYLKRPHDDRRIVLPVPAKTIHPKTLRAILSDAGLTMPEFLALR